MNLGREYMKTIIVLATVLSFGFGQILEIDSIVDPGNWVDPQNIFFSDDLYGIPEGNQDNIILSTADPVDTLNATLDSVKVHLEQHVSDTTKGFWYVVPIVNNIPGITTPLQAGSLMDSLLIFDISTDVVTWADLVGLTIDLHPRKSTGAPPDWFADYLYVFAYTTATGISEKESNITGRDLDLSIPTIVYQQTNFTFDPSGSTSILVEIYNASGCLVKEFNQAPCVQSYQITWRGDDNSGNILPSGVYFLRLQADDHCATEKFLLIR
jgi:hypothetical protein